MKAQTKAVIASLVVIALALTAVSGVTYSWFTDTEQADVSITTGNIVMTSGYTNIYEQSVTDTEKHYITTDGSTGTVVSGMFSCQMITENNTTRMKITFNNMVPGDEFGFTITNKINNTIKVNYAASYSIVETTNGEHIATPFIVSMNTTTQNLQVNTDEENPTEITDNISIKLPSSVGNEYMNRSYTMTLLFQAIQGNVQPTNVQSVIIPAETSSNITVSSGSSSEGDLAEASVSLPGFDEQVTVTAQSISSEEAAWTATSGGTVVGGIDVEIKKTDGSKIDTLSSPATVTMILNGDLTTEGLLQIYHEGSSTPVSSDSITIEGIRDAEGNVVKTSVTFPASEFSAYYAVTNALASINGTFYSSVESAIAAYDDEDYNNGYALKLYADVSPLPKTSMGKNINIDLNGNTFYFVKSSDGGYSYTIQKNFILSNGTVIRQSDAAFGKFTITPTIDEVTVKFENIDYVNLYRQYIDTGSSTHIMDEAIKVSTNSSCKVNLIVDKCTFDEGKIYLSSFNQFATVDVKITNTSFKSIATNTYPIQYDTYYSNQSLTIDNCTFDLGITSNTGIIGGRSFTSDSYGTLTIDFKNSIVNMKKSALEDAKIYYYTDSQTKETFLTFTVNDGTSIIVNGETTTGGIYKYTPDSEIPTLLETTE